MCDDREKLKTLAVAAKDAEAAFESLYAESVDYAYGVVSLYIKNEKDIEDVLQNVFIRVYSGLSGLHDPENYKAWLNRICKNESFRFVEKNVKRTDALNRFIHFNFTADESGDEVSDPGFEDKAFITEEIQKVIRRLPDTQRECVVLYYYENCTIPEISQSLHVSEGTIKSRLYLARKRLTKELDKVIHDNSALFGLSPMPLLVAFLRYFAVHSVPSAAIKASVWTAVSEATVVSGTMAISAAAAGSAAAGSAVAGSAAVSSASATVGAASATKIAAVVVASSVAVVGTGSTINHMVQNKEALETETEIVYMVQSIPETEITEIEIAELLRESSATAATNTTHTEKETSKPSTTSPHTTKSATTKAATTAGSTKEAPTAKAQSATTTESNATKPVVTTTAAHTTGATAAETHTTVVQATAATTAQTTKTETTTQKSTTTTKPTTTKPTTTTTKPTTTKPTTTTTKPTTHRETTTTQRETTAARSQYRVAGGVLQGYDGSDRTLVLPQSVDGQAVSYIGARAFRNNTDIDFVTIPGNIQTIGQMAFADCPNLQTAQIQSGVKVIDIGAFAGCDALRNVNIPSTVTTLGDEAFADCESLQAVTIPPGVTQIGEDAFDGCSGVVIHCVKDSVAHHYALENGIDFVLE